MHGWVRGALLGLALVGTALAAAPAFIWDPNVAHGTLPNGLRWFVEPSPSPPGITELRFVVNVGQGAEREDEVGASSMVEALSYLSVRHFRHRSLFSAFDAFPLPEGQPLDGYHTTDQFVWAARVPSRNDAALDAALTWFADIGGDLGFALEDVEAARSVAIDAAGSPDVSGALDWQGTAWEARSMPVQAAAFSTLLSTSVERYWRREFSPEQMAVVVVGDEDAARVGRAVEAKLKPLSKRGDPTPRVAPPTGLAVRVATEDPVAAAWGPAWASGGFVYKAREPYTESWLLSARAQMVTRLVVVKALNRRLAAVVGRIPTALTSAVATLGRDQVGSLAWTVTATTPPHQVYAGWLAVSREIAGVRAGVSPAEVAASRAEMDAAHPTAQEIEAEAADLRVEELLRHVHTGEPVMAADAWERENRRLFAAQEPQAVDAEAARAFPASGRTLLILQPAWDASVPSAAELAAELARGVVDVPTLTPAPGQPGRIVAEEVVDGRVVWRLSNGASLYFTASEPGATAVSLVAGASSSDITTEGLTRRSVMADVATASGLGDLEPAACARLFDAQRIRVLREVTAGGLDLWSVHGDARMLESVFHTMWASLAAPRFTARGVAAVLGQAQAMEAKVRGADPGAPILKLLTMRSLAAASMNVQEAARLHRERFGAMAEVHFGIIGAVPAEVLRPLVERYLASIPDGR